MKYKLYHIPGKKIGVTLDPKHRVEAQQGYGPSEYEILEESNDIDYISHREIELQKSHGYRVDETLYKQLNPNKEVYLSEKSINDAMLFMMMLSGRNPHYLIGEQVISAPIVNDLEIETIATGYILMDGGSKSTVEIISGTRSIPMNRIDVAVAHALAGQYLGMDLIYLEAGSGAKDTVSNNVIKEVSQKLEIPLIVGGGIRDANTAKEKVDAGASIIVTGNAIEKNSSLMSEIADSIHN